ncbi:MAG: hypothetical protein K6L81_14065 [Agarilytica sp.]
MNKFLITFLAHFLLVLASTLTHAEITSVTVTPETLDVDINTGLTVNLTWTVTLSDDNAVADQGEFFEPRSDGPLDTINTPISVIAPIRTEPQPVGVPEVLRITPEIAQFWWDIRVRQVLYHRTFEDTEGISRTGTVQINLVDGATNPVPAPATPLQGLKQLRGNSNELSVHRLELKFSDLNIINFVDSDDELKAQLEISYSGNGLLRGQWQISDPASSDGEPRFYTLSLVNQQLFEVQRSEIISPPLPTTVAGRYYLRFCVTGIGEATLAPQGATACPSEIISTAVGYQVFPKKDGIPQLKGLSPKGETVTVKTVFTWPNVSRASVTQLQILAAPHITQQSIKNIAVNKDKHTAPEFITGMLLPANVTETKLSNYITDQLVDGHKYYWRISIYGTDGSLLTRSKPIWFRFIQ